MTFPLAPLILGGLTLGSRVIEGEGAGKAAKKRVNAAGEAIDVQEGAQERYEQLSQPYSEFGRSAIDPLSQFLGLDGGGGQQQIDEINPVLSFLRDEGFQDIQESAAARGVLGNPGTLKELSDYNTNLAATVVPQLQSQKFGQLMQVLGIGQRTDTNTGSAGLQTASNISNLITGKGEAKAQQQIGETNAITGFLSDVAGELNFFGGGG